MKTRLPFLLILGLLTTVSLFGQTLPSKPAASPTNSYESLLAGLTGGNTSVDYTALRLAYSRSKDANPYGASHEARRSMNAAVIEGRCDEAIRTADTLLASIYISTDAHVAKSSCYRTAGDNAKADFHKAIYLGLINSILSRGDGSSPETAYTVVTVEEEYSVMKALGFTVWAQVFVHKGEHTYDLLSGTDDRSKTSAKVYFNVDIPLALERQRNSPK